MSIEGRDEEKRERILTREGSGVEEREGMKSMRVPITTKMIREWNGSWEWSDRKE